MKNKYLLAVLSIIIGLFFVLSGIGKIVNTIGFTNVLESYGLGYFSYLSPLICVGEIALGLLMLLLINLKKYSLYSLIVLFLFSASFAYAHFFKSVEDCGCFGEIGMLHSTATMSFLRNGILIIFCLIIFINSVKNETPPIKWKSIIIFSITALSLVLAGYTMSESLVTDVPFENQKVENTPLTKYINFSSDSTYLIFVFSYNCPHCWDATENIKSYLETKTVDKIIGIAGGDKIKENEYYDKLKPNFNSITISFDSLSKIVKVTPTVFIVKNNTIINVMQKAIYSPHTFKKYYPNQITNRIK